ncbi:hypothetical protein I4U23_011739 [Adineta vaga]|nr:hypothetical protein I4U23_011739 [Adineta vaga]
MPKQSPFEIRQIIERDDILFFKPTDRDFVYGDIIEGIHSINNHFSLKLDNFYFNDGTSQELLCLFGTVACQYQGNRYNIPIELWLQQDHPQGRPKVYVKPTSNMYISPVSKAIDFNGEVIVPELLKWHYPHSNLQNLLNAMSEAFSQSPPVFSHNQEKENTISGSTESS